MACCHGGRVENSLIQTLRWELQSGTVLVTWRSGLHKGITKANGNVKPAIMEGAVNDFHFFDQVASSAAYRLCDPAQTENKHKKIAHWLPPQTPFLHLSGCILLSVFQ